MQKSKNFNKELFEQLCREYKVELSTDYDKPMLKDSSGVHPIKESDIKSLFPFHQKKISSGRYRIDTGRAIRRL